MQIPEFIFLGTYKFYTLYIFMATGIALSSFVIWFEGKRDGFDEERIFDLFFLSILVGVSVFFFLFRPIIKVDPQSVVFYVSYFWTIGLQIFGAFILALLPVYLLTTKWKWSVYRILDIFVIAFCLGNSVSVLGYILVYQRYEFILILFGLFFMYVLFSRLRIARLNSGIIFSIFLFVICSLGFLFFRNIENLIFYGILILLSVLNIYFRRKSGMAKSNLPTNLINFLQQKLLSRRKDLKAEERLLQSEDPYLVSGRASDNSENMDEAILEDGRKELVDVRKNAITDGLVLIRKALAKIKVGKYGLCEVCGKPIDPARLKAYPEATTCLEHANAAR